MAGILILKTVRRSHPGRAAIGAFLLLSVLLSSLCQAKTRHYYIAAEDVTWDYAPSGLDLMHDHGVPQPWAKQTKWTKTRYIEYTDATFTLKKSQPEWLGILGPIIRAEVGDTVVVDFLNRSSKAHSIHPHGLRYDKANEGSFYLPAGGPGARVPPGEKFTYHWLADEGSGPAAGDPSSIVWFYHSHVDDPTEINAGLLGPIIVTAKGKANPDATPKGVDREFVVLFMIFDQLGGKNEGLFHSMNGYIFGNLPGLVMKQGEHVRWYLLGMGNERDLHTAHWHGKTLVYQSHRTDDVELLPGSMATADMVADNPGTWMFHCHVSDHMESGMMATYTIYQPNHCSSPVGIISGKFWQTDDYRVTVKNISTKSIKSIRLDFDYLMGPQVRRRPFNHEWTFPVDIAPGQGTTLATPAPGLKIEDGISGWVLYPEAVQYSNGDEWRPKPEGECFKVFWRDQDHPEMPILPSLQMEIGNED